MRLRILLFLLLGLPNLTTSQETTVINQYSDDGIQENYRLSQSSQYTFVVNYYTPEKKQEEELAILLSSGLNAFIDKSYQIGESQLIMAYEPSLMMSTFSSIINQGLDIFQIQERFDGFSDKVYTKLQTLSSMRWNDEEYSLLGESPQERKELLLYFIEKEVLDLKGICKEEIIAFLKNKKVIEIPEVWAKKMESSEVTMPGISYRGEDFIPPLEYTFDEPISSTEYEQDITLPESFVEEYNRQLKKKEKKARKQKDQFGSEVLALLQQNSEQLISIQRDLLEFQKENVARDREIRVENNDQVEQLQSEINELKEIVYAENKRPKDVSVYKKNEITELHVIYFDKNASDLNNINKIELNKVLRTLTLNPNFIIMITGYADKSGDPDFNAYISKKRAAEVQSYLYKKGIPKKRMVLNYLGDISSESENAGDRRVEIEFVNKLGQVELSSNE